MVGVRLREVARGVLFQASKILGSYRDSKTWSRMVNTDNCNSSCPEIRIWLKYSPMSIVV